jgi:hypothetical protein
MPRQVSPPPPPPPPADAPVGRVSLPALMPPRRRRGRYGLLLLAGVFVGLVLGLALLGREQIVLAWPEARAFYDLIGINATAVGAGLELGNVRFVRREVDGEDVIVIEGEVTNLTDQTKPLPTLRATLRNEQNQWLKDWTFRIDRVELGPGETANFRTTARNPPEASRRLSITFVEDAR